MLESAYVVAQSWLADGARVAAATLVGVEGSAPLYPGATMLVSADGRIEGSVTGGCVEGALYEQAHAVLTTVVDARAPFLRSGRFAVADETVVDWPDRYLATQDLTPRDVVLVFTHDPKFDVPAVTAALETRAGYIGALGSRRTHEDRLRRLAEAGVGEEALRRLSSPCGLDIGRRSPAE